MNFPFVQMVNKEKEVYINEEDSEKIMEVEKEIQEKEEILVKLMDTVKGYSAMKIEYEKLVDEINGLDAERRELELALERAMASKKTDGGKNIDRLQERFRKINEELMQMRNERGRKENAYKLMQKESKQCEQIAKELQSLKESKVQLQRKQKEQAQLHLKFKKENQAKLQQLKRSEVKKQQQLNELRNELQKKQRILGHKDKELARFQSKLKACEDHITQLLKIQSRNNNNLSSYSRSAQSRSAIKLNPPEDDVGGKYGFMHNLTQADCDHYVTSKNVLDNLCSERAEKRELCKLQELKANVIKDLTEELHAGEAGLKLLNAQLRSLEDESLQLTKDADVKDNPERRAEIEIINDDIVQVEQSIKSAESNVDRISKEIDLHTTDLKDMLAKVAKSAESNLLISSQWDDIGRNIVLGLSHAQAQTAVWELYEEKTDLNSRILSMQERVNILEATASLSEDKESAAEVQLAALKEHFRKKLQTAEAKRVGDVWAILRAQCLDGDGVQRIQEIADKATIQRAQELEVALEVCLNSEDALKEEVNRYMDKVCSLEQELAELRASVQLSTLPSETNEGLTDGTLTSVWNRLGKPSSERVAVLKGIDDAKNHALMEALVNAQSELLSTEQYYYRLKSEIETLQFILDFTQTQIFAKNSDYSLLIQINELEVQRNALVDKFRDFCTDLFNICRQLIALKEELQIDKGDPLLISSGLNELLSVPVFSFDSLRSADLAGEFSAFLDQFSSLNIKITEESLKSWIEGLKILELCRASTISRCIELRAESFALAVSLGFQSTEELNKFLEIGEKDMTEDVYRNAFEVIMQNASVHTIRGSLKLQAALERINVALTTMQINRETVSKYLASFFNLWGERIHSNRDSLKLPHHNGQELHQKDFIQGLFSNIFAALAGAHGVQKQFEEQISAIVLGLSLPCDDYYSYQSQEEQAALNDCCFRNELTASLKVSKGIPNMVIRGSTDDETLPLVKNAFKGIESIISELGEIALFVDELWIKKSIGNLESQWSISKADVTKVKYFRKILVLCETS
jgi:hypothetical protein